MEVLDKNKFEKSLARLYQRRQFGIKLGLEPVRRMCELLGNPQTQYGVIHVAGTNGKGSVCSMIASILQANGLKTGLYTSPHLVHFNERICVNGATLPDNELADALEVCERVADTVRKEQGHEATFFEITTVLAFECFKRNGVKLAVIETGLGGRLDATNVVMPLASVITSIAKDHTIHLGESFTEIAGEKAGIIKSGRPVIIAPQTDENIIQCLLDTASSLNASLTIASEAVGVGRVSGDLHGQKVHYETADGLSGTAKISLLGDHQLENLGVALATTEVLFNMLRIPLDPNTIKRGLENTRWNGRCQLLKEDPLTIIDAAHNPAGAKALVAVLKRNKIKHAGIVLGMCADKDAVGVLKELASIARRIWVVPVPNERNMPTEQLVQAVKIFSIDVEATSVDEALAGAEVWAKQTNHPIVITGSLFLLGDVLGKSDRSV